MPEIQEKQNTKRGAYLLYVLVLVVAIVIFKLLTQEDEDLAIVEIDIPIPQGQTGPLPDFSEFSNVVDKKKAFFGYLLPEIERQNALVLQERAFLEGLKSRIDWTDKDHKALHKLSKKYKVKEQLADIKKLDLLLRRVDIIPAELVMAQAANESAWGTSRFARKGYNFFGMWCFKRGCGFVPKRRDHDAAHEVAKFNDLSHAVAAYLRNLNRHPAYKELRDIRLDLRIKNQSISAEQLVHGLSSYSERGQDYIDELLQMIRFNRKYMQV